MWNIDRDTIIIQVAQKLNTFVMYGEFPDIMTAESESEWYGERSLVCPSSSPSSVTSRISSSTWTNWTDFFFGTSSLRGDHTYKDFQTELISFSTFPMIWFPHMFALIFAQFSFQFAARLVSFPSIDCHSNWNLPFNHSLWFIILIWWEIIKSKIWKHSFRFYIIMENATYSDFKLRIRCL